MGLLSTPAAGAVVLFAAAALHSQVVSIDVSGTVTDEAGAAVAGVEACLEKAGLCATTDAQGYFEIIGDTPVRDSFCRLRPRTDHVRNGQVSVTVHQSNSAVSIRLYDGRGRLVASADYRGLRRGVHRFAVPRPEAAAASGAFVLSVTNGDTRWTRQILSCGGRHGQAGSAVRPAVIARSSAPPVDYVDTLLLSASQKLNKRLGVDMSHVNVDTVVLIDESLGLTSGTFPRIDGSTSAHPLRVIMACNLLGTSYSWSQWFDGTIRADAYSSTRPALADSIDTMCVNSGTHGAYVSLIEDSSDIIVVARRPSADELALADSFDVMLDVRAVALDAFVFILNNRNPVTTLTLDEIRGIYTGQITNWSEVGGNDWAISPYQRNENSGSQELMYSMVMGDTPIMSAPDLVLPGMMGPINQLPADSAGIAYTVYFFKEFMAPSEFITMCGIDGIPPTYETIGARSYPLWNEVYVVIREDTPVSHNAYRMREWCLAPQGQAVVRESGYVPVREPPAQ